MITILWPDVTELVGSIGNASDLRSGSVIFGDRPVYQLLWQNISLVLSHPPRKRPGYYPKLGHGRRIPHDFHHIIRCLYGTCWFVGVAAARIVPVLLQTIKEVYSKGFGTLQDSYYIRILKYRVKQSRNRPGVVQRVPGS